MDKIYSRKRLLIPKLKKARRKSGIRGTFSNKSSLGNGLKNGSEHYNDLEKVFNKKLIKTAMIVMIAVFMANKIITTIEPTMDVLCVDMAKSISTKISNEQATVVMRKL